ncbi:tRNA-dihydrouridine synthase family protein [Candidatus Pacearchaeota archaeon]|nr:tRNA-dihydrouridine synthase family protein [Candidatus Pacearchaeota archaeon]
MEKQAKIGNLKLKNRYFLAPMAGVNDIAFRELCRKSGAGLVYTGMINPLSKEEIHLEDRPVLQIFCSSEKGLKEFVEKYNDRVSLFDFNLGCPAKVARECGFGVFMHNKIEAVEKILKIIRENSKVPFSIKIRKSRNAMKLAKLAEKYCDAIAIHPRTGEQGYSGEADIKFAEKIKRNIKIPVIYSGDVDERNADELLKKFDFVMIGRKALGNPNIFANLTGNKTNFTFRDYIETAKKYKLKFSQIKMQAMYFTKNVYGAGEMREKLMRAKTIEEIGKIMS